MKPNILYIRNIGLIKIYFMPQSYFNTCNKFLGITFNIIFIVISHCLNVNIKLFRKENCQLKIIIYSKITNFDDIEITFAF